MIVIHKLIPVSMNILNKYVHFTQVFDESTTYIKCIKLKPRMNCKERVQRRTFNIINWLAII